MSHPTNSTPVGVVLAGGASARMGTTKATLVRPDGRTSLEHALGVLGAVVPRVTVSLGVDQFDIPRHIEIIHDEMPGQGPACAVASALAAVGGPVLVVGCDMPDLTVEAVRWLVGAWTGRDPVSALISRDGDHWEPLLAIYGLQARASLAAWVAGGGRSLQRWIRDSDAVLVDVPPEHAVALTNVNTPEAWALWYSGRRDDERATRREQT